MRLAVLHPVWGHGVEAPAERKASGTDCRHRQRAARCRIDAAPIGGEAQEIEFVRLENRSRGTASEHP